MIELTGFGKDYGEFTAVESLDLKIEEGEMFGFIGPNGACLLYTSPSPRDGLLSRMPSSA